jgi:thiosulfate/3-mercaptopyruvate sulfurtransferase
MAYTTLIDPVQLQREYTAPRWVVFDCRFDLADKARGERDYRTGHIPGARFAHLERELSGPITASSGRHPLPDPAALNHWLGTQGVGPGTQVVAYDDSAGSMAVRLWWLLRWLGHRQVAVLDGGWQAWRDARLGETTAIPPPAATQPYPGRPNASLLVTTEQLLAELGSGRWRVLDARTGERFRGEKEPIDPVAGHIPGARSLPLQANLGADGRFLNPDRLRQLYQAELGDHAPSAAACMCGSGVTACHDLLAMEIAGLNGARLYAGSWSEWIRDPARPVALGPE